MPEWIEADKAAALIKDGARVALGGSHSLAPMTLAWALVRRGSKNLDLVTTPTGGFAVELLVGAGLVRSVETAQVSLGELGLAPAFRQAVEERRLKVLDTS